MVSRVREVFFLLDADGAILYRDAGSSATFIPDSRTRWEAIWEHRDKLVEIAHSHPIGPLAFSAEDETTMQALQSALGTSLVFSVVAPSGMLRREGGKDLKVEVEPGWAAQLRTESGMDR